MSLDFKNMKLHEETIIGSRDFTSAEQLLTHIKLIAPDNVDDVLSKDLALIAKWYRSITSMINEIDDSEITEVLNKVEDRLGNQSLMIDEALKIRSAKPH